MLLTYLAVVLTMYLAILLAIRAPQTALAILLELKPLPLLLLSWPH